MSGGFSFPPPPPPPPKAAPEWNGGQNAQYGSQSRGGRGMGRGRGAQDVRGRGRGSNHRGQGNQFANGNQHANPNFAGTAAGNGTYGAQQPAQSIYQPPYNQAVASALPPGAYVNPNFVQRPAGHVNGYNQGRPLHTAHGAVPPPSTSPPRTYAGHKRKLDALRPPPVERPKPGPQAAPVIPGFGASLLPQKPVNSLPPNPVPSRKPASNALGLTPGEALPQYPSSDDEAEDKDVDEEALHAELGAKLTFEHNGMVLSLKSTADIAAWQEERRKNWPTRARMTEKEAERRRTGEERRRLLAGAAVLEGSAASRAPRTKQGSSKTRRFSSETTEKLQSTEQANKVKQEREPESAIEKARRDLAEQTAKLDVLRKRVAAGEASLEKARAVQEERDIEAMKSMIDGTLPRDAIGAVDSQLKIDADAASETSSEALSDSSVLSSDSSPDQESDDDGPPEESTSKAPATSGGQLPKLLCKYYIASGYCRDGDACGFRHELPPRGTVGVMQPQQRPQQPRPEVAPKLDYSATADKKSIYQRLMEQQQEEEDRLALQVIKYLGKAGFFSADANEAGPS
ncbi:hypothetical protein LTR36_008881 [Oleoguttula mirabilis]|uniref:C3H1-type domain-containing protein n=1 Tax=Oleoguttula mirabilis TaxID=1507867 RepID=A0AAV9J770_9PEZI|nr:hypothetical protein LTR36_008881 [Oleoguttula mirabilis]